jgi:PAS domain S-box-containing protein
MKISLDHSSIIAAILAAILLMGVGYLSLTGMGNLVETTRWVEHTQIVIDHLQTLLTEVDEESRMARSLVLTDNPAYRDSFEKARLLIPPHFEELKQLTSDNPTRQSDLVKLKELLDQQMAVMVQLSRSSRPIQHVELAGEIEKSNQLIDQIRTQISAMEDDERRLLQERTAAAVEDAHAVRSRIIVGSGLGLIVILGSAFYLNRETMARRQTQRELDRFFSLTNDLFCIAGFDGYFKRLNPAWEKPFGYTMKELLAQPFESFLHPDDIEGTRQLFASLKGGQRAVSFENRYRCKDGSYRWLLWNAHPLVDDQLVFASARDMTERKRIEEELRQSEEHLRLMVESVRDYAILMLDPEGRIVSWNAGAERIKGYTATEILGRHFSVFYPEEKKREGFPDRELQVAAAKGRSEDEGWRVRKDGSRFFANVVITAMRDSEGKLLGFVKVTRDVSDRRKAENALRQRQQMFEGLFENSPDAVVLVNQEGRIVRVNAQIGTLFGYTRDELEGEPVETLMPERYRAQHGGHLAGYFAAPRTRAMGAGLELFARRKDGSEFPADIMLSPLKTDEGDHALAVIRDITSRKQAAEKIQKLNGELKQRADLLEVANKELESFSYSVSHDLRAPLRHIHGFVEMLQKSPALEKEASAHRYMEVISKAAKQMGLLIDDLLAFSRTGRAEINPAKIKMREMVDQVIRDFEMDCKDRKIVWDIQLLSVAEGDTSLMRLVWVNLLGNAIKYTRTRAEAKIEIGELDGADKNPSAREGEVVYYVRDNGVGFDMRYAPKLFGVFQRLHRAEDFEGTGIGLANVQRIVHRHGGRVWADGKVEAGATFFFSLPVTPTIQPK